MNQAQAAANHQPASVTASTRTATPIQARTLTLTRTPVRLAAWPVRLAAVIAVSMQIIAAIGGVLLLIFWIWATLDATLLDL